MKNFFHDILRDKGSTKFSITKTTSLLFTLMMIFYLGYSTIKTNTFDHVMIVEILAFISALLGLKNKWGVVKNDEKKTINFDSTSMDFEDGEKKKPL